MIGFRRHALIASVMLLPLFPRSSALADDGESLEIASIERISLDELIGTLVRTAPALARASADAAIARGEAQAAEGIDDWNLSFDLSGARRTNTPIDGQPVQVTANEQIEGRAGLSRSLPTGGLLSVRTQATRSKEDHRIEAGLGAEARSSSSRALRASGEVSLTHPLLRGLGRSVARADLEKARNAQSAGLLRAQVESAELLRDVISAYWDLVNAAMTLEVRRASLEMANKVLKETRDAVRHGDRAKTELQSAEYAVAVREEEALAAEIALEEAGLGLRQISGLEIGPNDISLWPSDIPDVEDHELKLKSLVKRGLAKNPALLAVEIDGDNAMIDVRVAENGKRPRLDLTISGGAVGTGRNFDGAVRNLGDNTEYQVSAGLSFSLDIGRNAAKGAYATARGRRRNARIGIEELRREVASSIVLAVHRIRAARKRARVAAKAAKLATANLRAERARFALGRSSSRELYERQGEIDDARLSRVRALADYHQSLARLQTLTGQILIEHELEIIE